LTHDVAGAAVAAEPDETRRIYQRIASGGADGCNCQPCQNFRLVRDEAYPAEFRALLEELGIDYRKELEVYGGDPLPDGSHVYEGWFCFVGKAYGRALTVPYGETAFHYQLSDTARSPQREFDGQSVLHLAFRTTVRWRLPQPWSLS
jgi:hypothetical protein